MAWRIADNVIRGEIDNRRKGIVRGTIWLAGIAEPVVLDLIGNACADLAGCLLKFTNTQPPVPMRKDAAIAPIQRGHIGDLTASQKVRVYDVPTEEAYAMCKRGERPPEHMANALYLEWFSEFNGRVLIQSADYQLEVSAPEWRGTPEDEAARQSDSGTGWTGFADRLDAAVEKRQQGAKDPEEKWDEHDYERFLKEADARTDKYAELLEKYGDSDEAEQKIAEEMGWAQELTEEEAEEEQRRIDEMNAACEAALNEPEPEPDPLREGIDWIRTADGDIRHPLQNRCFEAAMSLWHQCKELGLGQTEGDDVGEFLFQLQATGAKLAGALNTIARGFGFRDAAFTVAYLKRALDRLHKSQAALEAAASKPQGPGGCRLPDSLVTEARRHLFDIREGILQLMQEYRDRE